LPVPGLPVTLIPLARKASVRSLAAYVAGSFTRLPLSRLSLPVSADSSPHSSCRPGFQDGMVRFLSNQLSSPNTRPWTLRTLSVRRRFANDSNEAVVRCSAWRW